jgi:hypothetical protein
MCLYPCNRSIGCSYEHNNTYIDFIFLPVTSTENEESTTANWQKNYTSANIVVDSINMIKFCHFLGWKKIKGISFIIT